MIVLKSKDIVICSELITLHMFSLLYDVKRGEFLRYRYKKVPLDNYVIYYVLTHKGRYYFVKGFSNQMLQIVYIDFEGGIKDIVYYKVGRVYIPWQRKLPEKLVRVLKYFIK